MHRILIGILLCDKLCHRIRRETVSDNLLPLRHRFVIAIDRSTRRIGELLHPVFRRRLHHIDRTDDVCQRVLHRLLDALRHTHRCRLMQHIVHALTDAIAECRVTDVPFDKLELRIPPKSRDILRISRRQIVQHTNPVPHRENRLSQIRSDETRPAGDEEKTVFWKCNGMVVHNIPFLLYVPIPHLILPLLSISSSTARIYTLGCHIILSSTSISSPV